MLENFNLSPLEKEMFINYENASDYDCLLMLELYKLVSREEIVFFLQKDFPNIILGDDIALSHNFDGICNSANVLIQEISPKVLRIITPVYGHVNDTCLSINLYNYELEVVTVTPLTYLQLKNSNVNDLYDYELLFKRILIEAIKVKATDLHLSVEHTDEGIKYPVFFRVNGSYEKCKLFNLDKRLNNSIISKLIEKKTDSNSTDLNNSAGVTTSISNYFKSRVIELRVSASSVMDGSHCVIRIQEKTTTSLSIEQLGFASPIIDGLKALAYKRNGITFITGAIRTGKNTTAFAIANEMLKDSISLTGYDSPVEVLMPFPQVDYKEDPQRLLDCVRLAKKQDVDVAFLNEIPSKNVAFAVKDLVNSSVGVVTTLHLDRIWDLPYRLYEYYGETYKDIISQINGIVNQKMFGIMCPYCQKLIKVSDISNKGLKQFLTKNSIVSVNTSEGCDYCSDSRFNNSGYVLGKNQPYAEFLIFTPEIKEALLMCDTTWQMSLKLKEFVYKYSQNLEVYMLEAIQNGNLSYKALQQVI